MTRRKIVSSAGMVAIVSWLLLSVSASHNGGAFSTGPSAFCHVTDGAFTDCDPGGGVEEWSDIDFLAGLGTSAGAIVYSDQSVSPPRLLLMYDLTGHTTPLAPDSFFDITFHVVEEGDLEVYTVQCFGDGSFRVFEDGEDITDEADTVDCAVGFDGNVLVELEIDTLVTYSPDIPLFWSTAAPPPGRECPPEDPNCQPCPPEQPGCQPRASSPAGLVPTSSTILVASSDGTTQVVGLPVGAPLAPTDLCNRATGGGFLVDLLSLQSDPNHGQRVRRVSRQAREALASLVAFGLISSKDAGKIHGCVVSSVAKSKTSVVTIK